MSGFSGHAFALGLPWIVGSVLLVVLVTFLFGRRLHRHNVVDTAWGLFFVVAAVASFATSSGHGDATRRVLLLVLPALWGLRLAQHVGIRSRGKGEDQRYSDLLDRGEAKGHSRDAYALRMIYTLQFVLAVVISAPLAVGAFEFGSVGVLGWIGVASWCLGVFFEGVGDLQMERFQQAKKAGRTDKKIMDTGLWRYTRHPNYFGDACVWWGMFLVAAERWPGVLTVFAPVIMTLLLTVGSGTRILEKHMSTREGWDEYRLRTSEFVPLPPALTRRLRARAGSGQL